MKKPKNLKISLAAGALVVAGVVTIGATKANATSIAIGNYSFEADPPLTSPPTDWSSGTVSAAQIGNNSSPTYDYITPNGTATGSQFLQLKPNYGQPTATQTTSYDAQLGDAFTLTVAIGDNNGRQNASDFIGAIDLVIDGNVVATDNASGLPSTFDTSDGHDFEDATTTFTLTPQEVVAIGDPDLVGGAVGVELTTPSADGNEKLAFDNVRLDVSSATESSTPEPSASSMIACGFASILAWLGWRSRRNA